MLQEVLRENVALHHGRMALSPNVTQEKNAPCTFPIIIVYFHRGSDFSILILITVISTLGGK